MVNLELSRLGSDFRGSLTTTHEPQTPPPVILTIPHDGILGPITSWSPFGRRGGIRVRDRRVWELARTILEGAQIPVGVVRGKAPRWMIDYNRYCAEAFEHPILKIVYDEYHSTIQNILEKSIRVYGGKRCLLLDIHGFKNQPPYAPEGGFDVILGTANRRTIHHGNIDRELGIFLAEYGYSVYIPEEKPFLPETPDPLSGQFTTRHYSMIYGINTIQLEISPKHRYGNPKATKRLAFAINNFFSNYYMDRAA